MPPLPLSVKQILDLLSLLKFKINTYALTPPSFYYCVCGLSAAPGGSRYNFIALKKSTMLLKGFPIAKKIIQIYISRAEESFNFQKH